MSKNNNHTKGQCKRIDLAKYVSRPGPPYPANDVNCHGKYKLGNDGEWYRSVPDTRGIHAWKKTRSSNNVINLTANSSSNNDKPSLKKKKKSVSSLPNNIINLAANSSSNNNKPPRKKKKKKSVSWRMGASLRNVKEFESAVKSPRPVRTSKKKKKIRGNFHANALQQIIANGIQKRLRDEEAKTSLRDYLRRMLTRKPCSVQNGFTDDDPGEDFIAKGRVGRFEAPWFEVRSRHALGTWQNRYEVFDLVDETARHMTWWLSESEPRHLSFSSDKTPFDILDTPRFKTWWHEAMARGCPPATSSRSPANNSLMLLLRAADGDFTSK